MMAHHSETSLLNIIIGLLFFFGPAIFKRLTKKSEQDDPAAPPPNRGRTLDETIADLKQRAQAAAEAAQLQEQAKRSLPIDHEAVSHESWEDNDDEWDSSNDWQESDPSEDEEFAETRWDDDDIVAHRREQQLAQNSGVQLLKTLLREQGLDEESIERALPGRASFRREFEFESAEEQKTAQEFLLSDDPQALKLVREELQRRPTFNFPEEAPTNGSNDLTRAILLNELLQRRI